MSLHINIIVIDKYNAKLHFRISKEQCLQTLLTACSQRLGVNETKLRFVINMEEVSDLTLKIKDFNLVENEKIGLLYL